MSIKFKQYKVDLVFGQYGNRNTAIIFMGAKGSKYQGEEIAVATVNGETVLDDPDVCGFKSWNDNIEIVDALVNGGIIEPAPIHTEPIGFGYIQYHCLTEKGKKLRDSCRISE